jgi:hypothetical protein
MLRKSLMTAVVISLTAASAQAVTLANVEGSVFVNSGSGFRPAAAGTALSAGDRVRTEKGSADIVYENGCSSRLEPHQIAAILSTPPACAAGGGLKDGPVAEEGLNPLILGGVVAAGVGIGIVVTNNPASP